MSDDDDKAEGDGTNDAREMDCSDNEIPDLDPVSIAENKPDKENNSTEGPLYECHFCNFCTKSATGLKIHHAQKHGEKKLKLLSMPQRVIYIPPQTRAHHVLRHHFI